MYSTTTSGIRHHLLHLWTFKTPISIGHINTYFWDSIHDILILIVQNVKSIQGKHPSMFQLYLRKMD